MSRDYMYTPPATHGAKQPRTRSGFSYRLIWEIAAIAGSIAAMLVFLYLWDMRAGIPYVVGISAFTVLLLLIEIFMASGSQRIVEFFVRGGTEKVRTRLDRIFSSEGLAIVWTGARHGGVYPREVLDFHASGPFEERRIAAVSLAELSHGRTAVRLVSEGDILVTGISGSNAENRRFERIASNLKSRFEKAGAMRPTGDRRPPEPVEDPVVEYIPDRRMYSVRKNVYCPKCGYEFTAHSVVNSPRVRGGRTRCPECHVQFQYSMEKVEKRRPRKVPDRRLAQPEYRGRRPRRISDPGRMRERSRYPPYPHSPTRRRRDQYRR